MTKYIGSFHPLIQLVKLICKLNTRIFFTFCMRPIHSLQKLFPFVLSTQRSKGKKTNFPLFYATKYLGFLLWNLSELNLFLRSVVCPNQRQSKYTKIPRLLTSMTDNKPLNYKGRCEKSMGFFSPKWHQRAILLM